MIKDRLSGNEALAVAMRQIEPDVVAAYPITPSTEVPQYFSSFVSDGKVRTEFIPVESEHSAMSACVGASSAGARTMTATSANGLAYMWEVLYIAASSRLPIVMGVANRALSGPININCDHSDAYGARDSGWIQLYCENNQEVYDSALQAVKIAEHDMVKTPVMVCYDGFITSHAVENIELLEDEEVKNYVGKYCPKHHLLDSENPIAVGPLDVPAYYFEHKRNQAEGLKNAKKVIKDTGMAFLELTGRKYGFLEEYKTEDADICIVAMGSTAGTAKYVADMLRQKGIKAGVVKVRMFRPFPAEEIAYVLSRFKSVAVIDRAESFSDCGGALILDVTSALYVHGKKVKVLNYIYGLGGRDVTTDDLEYVFNELCELKDGKEKTVLNYLGVRGEDNNAI